MPLICESTWEDMRSWRSESSQLCLWQCCHHQPRHQLHVLLLEITSASVEKNPRNLQVFFAQIIYSKNSIWCTIFSSHGWPTGVIWYIVHISDWCLSLEPGNKQVICAWIFGSSSISALYTYYCIKHRRRLSAEIYKYLCFLMWT